MTQRVTFRLAESAVLGIREVFTLLLLWTPFNLFLPCPSALFCSALGRDVLRQNLRKQHALEKGFFLPIGEQKGLWAHLFL